MTLPKLPITIGRFFDAVHKADTNAFISFFPNDGVLIDSGRRFTGHAQILGWSDREFIGARGRMQIRTVEESAEEVIVTGRWASNFYTGLARFAFTLDGDKIRQINITGT